MTADAVIACERHQLQEVMQMNPRLNAEDDVCSKKDSAAMVPDLPDATTDTQNDDVGILSGRRLQLSFCVHTV